MSKILTVEDEESIADLEKDYLELSGFEVEVANDGQTVFLAISPQMGRLLLIMKYWYVTGFLFPRVLPIPVS